MVDKQSLFFTIISFDKNHDWDELLEHTNNFLTLEACNQLEQLLGKVAKSVIIENEYIDKDFRDTFSHFHSRRFVTVSSRCFRLHFFASKIERDDIGNSETLQKSYLGYSILRPTRPNCIGRTFLNPECRKPLGHILTCKETVLLRTVELSVEGFPFISQDGDATVCAESVMWMMIRYFSNKYNLYRERYPFEITKLTENHAVGSRVYPSAGLSVWQISESLRHAGFSTLLYGDESPEGDPQRLKFYHQISSYIESGIPLTIAVPRHVVIAMGHTHKLPQKLTKRFTFSSQFYESIIIHDDNVPAYQELQVTKTAPSSWATSNYSFEDIDAFVVPLAEKIFLRVEDFEEVVMTLLDSDEFGIDNNSASLKGEKLILRVFLTTGKSFKKKIPERNNMGHKAVEHLYSEMPLPHFIWVCEISTLDDYKQQEILGEIIWDATRNAHEPHGFIAIHYPEILYFDSGALFNQPQEFDKIELKDSTPYLLYTSNLQEY